MSEVLNRLAVHFAVGLDGLQDGVDLRPLDPAELPTCQARSLAVAVLPPVKTAKTVNVSHSQEKLAEPRT